MNPYYPTSQYAEYVSSHLPNRGSPLINEILFPKCTQTAGLVPRFTAGQNCSWSDLFNQLSSMHPYLQNSIVNHMLTFYATPHSEVVQKCEITSTECQQRKGSAAHSLPLAHNESSLRSTKEASTYAVGDKLTSSGEFRHHPATASPTSMQGAVDIFSLPYQEDRKLSAEPIKGTTLNSFQKHSISESSYKRRSADRSCTEDERADLLKRYRTSYSQQQLRILEQTYQAERYISRPQRSKLAQDLKLPENTIKVWFQNRRMKEKRQSLMLPTLAGRINPLFGCSNVCVTQTRQYNIYQYTMWIENKPKNIDASSDLSNGEFSEQLTSVVGCTTVQTEKATADHAAKCSTVVWCKLSEQASPSSSFTPLRSNQLVCENENENPEATHNHALQNTEHLLKRFYSLPTPVAKDETHTVTASLRSVTKYFCGPRWTEQYSPVHSFSPTNRQSRTNEDASQVNSLSTESVSDRGVPPLYNSFHSTSMDSASADQCI
ncbi:homeobox even-skipped homolog protein 1 [Clonorchis sinensis]|uniref:Homeobox even-skipped homolog protein 1 n=1 Tax=Clonorchis sinensis TaxID=79923 RepID=G7Y747_CLOSI|nr:homeobox even-skipped homolog protein 1 [Clonorchis sinensis]